MKHTTKTGQSIGLSELTTAHLGNIIRLNERRAKNGIYVRSGGMGFDVDSIWYDEHIIYGKEALEYLNQEAYINERKKRIK